MLKDAHVFSGFSVKDLEAAKQFYEQVLGLTVEKGPMGMNLKFGAEQHVFVYQKDDHQPATFTILNFSVSNIDETVKALKDKGVEFISYQLGDGPKTDENDIMRGLAAKMGPDIAWFKDPAGNTLAVLQEK
jgi:predicted enzyme related to lactoylglutathione lyase